jgi:hypothetical protein
MRLILVGSVLVVLGGLALWFGGVPYTRDQVFELGPIEARTEVRERLDIPPLAGGAVLALGVGLAVYGATRRR